MILRRFAVQKPKQAFSKLSKRSIIDIVSGDSKGQGSDNRTFVRGFGDHCFQVNEVLVRDSVLLLPQSFYIWKAKTFDAINEDSLSIFPLLFPTVELIIIGCGLRVPNRLSPELVQHFRSKGIVVELMNSTSALTTFNVLNGEGRNVGAAILPLHGIEKLV